MKVRKEVLTFGDTTNLKNWKFLNIWNIVVAKAKFELKIQKCNTTRIITIMNHLVDIYHYCSRTTSSYTRSLR